MYKVQFLKSAAKEFRALDDTMNTRVTEVIDKLMINPRPKGVRKLKGRQDLYRIRVGSFRVVYEIIDEMELIQITRIRRRSEVYR